MAAVDHQPHLTIPSHKWLCGPQRCWRKRAGYVQCGESSPAVSSPPGSSCQAKGWWSHWRSKRHFLNLASSGTQSHVFLGIATLYILTTAALYSHPFVGRLKGEEVGCDIQGAHMRPQKSQAQACSTAGFLCKPQALFLVVCQRRTTAGPHITGTGWRPIRGSTHEPEGAGNKWYENFERSNRFGICGIPILTLQKATLLPGKPQAIRASSLESEVWPKPCWGVWTPGRVLRAPSSLAESRTVSKGNLGCGNEMRQWSIWKTTVGKTQGD